MKMIAALAIAGMAIPATAQAENPKTAHNVQCFMVAGLIASTGEGDDRQQAAMAGMFFAGQIFGAEPDIDLTAVAVKQVPEMTDAKIKALADECGTELTNRSKQLSDTGDALKKAVQDDVAKANQ